MSDSVSNLSRNYLLPVQPPMLNLTFLVFACAAVTRRASRTSESSWRKVGVNEEASGTANAEEEEI